MSQPPRAAPFYDDDDDIHDPAFATRRGWCCFCFPNLLGGKKHPGGGGAAFWQRIRPPTAVAESSPRWWRRGWKKVSGLSEVGDGRPRWKRLIRRFDIRKKKRRGGGYGKFHYDATSYALNFDDGPLDSGDYFYYDEDLHGRGFSDRYSLPPSAKCSMDFDHDLNFGS
ncbi:hypothetical protein LINGRAHAP2_LOCUS34195 [Linum grandiflorum]